jgi:hemerythrin-like domain-containing protein
VAVSGKNQWKKPLATALRRPDDVKLGGARFAIPEEPVMEHLAIPQQLLVEHQTLAHVISALRATIGWKYQGADFKRKLESLRFVGESFKRHLKHLMELEESDGYMCVVVDSRPELKDDVEALRREHAQFRTALRSMSGRLRKQASTDHDAFNVVCADFLKLLDKLDEHSKKETDLLQDALLTDEGGEG